MINKFSTKLLILTVLFLFAGISQIFAQAGTGSITGVVKDSNNAVIPNATIKYVNKDTGFEKTTVTSDDGIYTLPLLPPGRYNVTASSASFAEQTLDVEVQVGRTTDADFTLGVGNVSAIVDVSAEGIQTTQNNSDAVLSETAITNLPINGRRFQDFVTLTPTAQIDTERNQISLSGQRGINANINVDGVDYNQPFFGGIRGGERSNFAPTIPQESIKEFQVVAAGYNAEYGRSTGGIVNVVTKGGTNEFRGSAFYLLRPEQFSRNNDFVKRLEQVNNLDITAAPTQTQYGGSVGGPIIKNKLFFFGSYEQQSITFDRFVLFTGLDNVTVTSANQQGINYFRSLETDFQSTNNAKTALGRIDWNINNSNLANFRYSWNNGTGLNAVAVGDAGTFFNPASDNALSNEGTEIDKNNVFVAQLISTLSPKYINDFRFQYAKGERPRLANAQTPAVTVASTGAYGTRSFLPTTQFDERTQFVDGLSITEGNHNIKVGGEFSNIFIDQLFGFNQFGSYTFSGGQSAALAALSLDPTNPNDRRFDSGTFYTQQIGNLAANFNGRELAFYGQDTWRITPKFTLNFGLRLEKQYNPDAELGNDAIISLVQNASFPLRGGQGLDPTQIPDSEWQVGPRLGFAWDVNGDSKSVLRGYSGVYYARTPALIIAGPLNNFRLPPGDVTVQIPFATTALTANTAAGVTAYNSFLTANPNYISLLSGVGLTCPQVTLGQTRNCIPNTVFRQFAILGINANNAALDSLPSLSSDQLQQIAGRLGLGIAPGIGANLFAFDEDFRNPRSIQFGLGYEKEISQGFVVGVDYSYVRTTRLQRNRDINLPVPVPTGPVQRPTFDRNNRPIPQLGRVILRQSSAQSLYNAFTIKARYNRKWVNLNAFYTLSKNQSDDDNERSATTIYYENSYDLSSEYGAARLDRRHQFVASPIFFLPYGFEFSSAIRLRSGIPVDIRVGSDLNSDGINNDRPYFAAGVPLERNFFRNRPEYGVDIRGQKGFRFGERQRLIFSAEIFNLFNNSNIQYSGSQTNYCFPTNDQSCGLNGPTNANFLQLRDANGDLITSNTTRTPVFQMQFGVRFQF